MTNQEAIKELKDTLERLNLNKYFSVKLVGVKMPYGEVEEKKDLNGLWLAISEAIKALEREEGCKDISDWPSSYFQCSECENIVCDEMETKINYCPNCGRRVEK